MKITITKDDGTIIEMYDLTADLKRKKLYAIESMDAKTLIQLVLYQTITNIEYRLKIWRNGL